ncbi:callose synthase 12-like [Actinidia eriantha]|uniref:callose synthase 12-like n=1 Tax=Actinidia eriantha TaxID=165200 RepID=UPI0025825DFE|nr:callose synthase 12-like [Actinidia eriantha]
MSLRQRPPPAHPAPVRPDPTPEEEAYNIIPIHNLLADHPSLRYPEVRAAAAALRTVGDLRKPPFTPWRDHMDLLDWLGAFFGFQNDNVRNQREHLVLHLANAQMRLSPPPENIDALDAAVLSRFRRKLLKNYTSWCSFLGRKSNVWISESARRDSDRRRELLYVSLYLLIWGESANLRFVPECICYIFHHMCMELNKILEDYIDENTGRPVLPSISGENAFLNRVVKPIYETIRAEVGNSKNGTAPHSAWRNYDDINEYFWSRRCFEKLKWPTDVGSNFFVTNRKGKHVGKTGFVEQRSFFNLFRSFDKLWIMLILFLQAAIIVAWERKEFPWQALEKRSVQARALSVFVTWSFLRFMQSLLDAGMQYSLVSRETLWLGFEQAFFRVGEEDLDEDDNEEENLDNDDLLDDDDTSSPIYGTCIRIVFISDTIVGNSVVYTYCKCKKFIEARNVFDEMLYRNAYTWNAIIAGLIASGENNTDSCIWKFVKGMQFERVTLFSIVPACSSVTGLTGVK